MYICNMANKKIDFMELEDDYISLETAKLAKEKGFNVLVCSAWVKYPNARKWMFETYLLESYGDFEGDYVDFQNWNSEKGIYFGQKSYSAPTQALLRKWLKKVHNIDLWSAQLNEPNKYHIEDITKDDIIIGGVSECSPTYEESLEKGLFEALKLI